MIDPKTKLEHGGKVRISGVWHEVENGNPEAGSFLGKIGDFYYPLQHMISVIEEYQPPTPKPYDWSTGCASFGDDINAALTARHSDPTMHTYTGQDPSRYGLHKDDWILRVCFKNHAWFSCQYKNIVIGDQWRKQPPAPKGSTL